MTSETNIWDKKPELAYNVRGIRWYSGDDMDAWLEQVKFDYDIYEKASVKLAQMEQLDLFDVMRKLADAVEKRADKLSAIRNWAVEHRFAFIKDVEDELMKILEG